jgi:hypothetical protein
MRTRMQALAGLGSRSDQVFCDISDARMGNKTIPKWGTRLVTARDLASSLRWRAIMNGFDISDGYHVLLLTGCTGELVMGSGITGVRRQCLRGRPGENTPRHSRRGWVVPAGS